MRNKEAQVKKLLLALAVLLSLALPAQADEPTSEAQTIYTAQRLKQSTVQVFAGTSISSGFFVGKNTILTSEHGTRKGSIKVLTADERMCDARLGYRDEGADLALLHVECDGTPLQLGKPPELGQTVLAMGHPDYYGWTLSRGIVSAYRTGYMQLDIRVDYGSSGGVVSDVEGNVIGVIKAKSTVNQLAFAVPVERIRPFLERAGVSQ